VILSGINFHNTLILKTGVFMRLRYILFTCVVFALVLGCAKPPLAEMDSAREAVFRAENDADAVVYGSNSLARARDALRRMQIEADSKRYDAARTLAAEAIAAAERAIADGRTGVVRAREEAASALAGLSTELEDTSRNISGARYSQLDLDYDALERDLRGAYNLTDRAEADQAEGRYQDALDKARDVRASLFDINQKVSTAVTRKK
jgi:hypothetical protein